MKLDNISKKTAVRGVSRFDVRLRRLAVSTVTSLLLLSGVSRSEAQTWEAVTDGLPTKPVIKVIATGPGDLMVADVEDLDNPPDDRVLNNGIYLSVDGGGSWSKTTGTIGEVSPRANAILVSQDSSNQTFILLGRSGGGASKPILRSTSSVPTMLGANWSEATGDVDSFGNIQSFTRSGTGPGTVIFASDIQNGVLISEDFGVSWTLVDDTGLPLDTMGEVNTRIFDLISVGGSASGELFASLEDGADDGDGGIYKSPLTGGGWALSLASTAIMDLFNIGGNLYAAELNSNIGAIHRSDNDGATWSSQTLGAVQTSLAATNSTLFVGGFLVNEGGPVIFQSAVTDGITWASAPIGDLPFKELHQLAVSGGYLYASTSQDAGSGGEATAGLFRFQLVNGRIPLSPQITQQPQGGSITVGRSFTFTVTASGDPTLRYQWRKRIGDDDVDITGETMGTLSLTDVQLSDGGDYSVLVSNDIGNAVSNRATLAVLEDIPGTEDPSFQAGGIGKFDLGNFSGGEILDLAVTAAGKIVLGGTFDQVGTGSRTGIARINADGQFDNTFNNGPGIPESAWVRSLAVDSDNNVVIGGTFTSVNGNSAIRLARLNADAGSNLDFAAAATPNGSDLHEIVLIAGGKLLVAGTFTTVNSVTRRGIARLLPDGTVDSTFQPPSDLQALVQAMAVQADGKIVIGGDFNLIHNNISYPRILRLNPDGDLDVSFSAGSGAVDGVVDAIAIQADGKILVGGRFTDFGGSTVGRIVRLNANGDIDADFNAKAATGANDQVTEIVVQTNGKILVGGEFTTFGTGVNSARTYLTRLNADGSIDDEFNIGSGVAEPVTAIALETDGDILVGMRHENGTSTVPKLLIRLIGDPPPPSIILQPEDLVAEVGDDVTLTVSATGSPPLTYKWTRAGDPATVLGTATTFMLTNIGLADDGDYIVTVSNALGNVQSNIATLTVLAPLQIVQQPTGVSGTVGDTISLDVVVTGLGPFEFQWQREHDGTVVLLSNSDSEESTFTENDIEFTRSTLAIGNAQTEDAGNYRVTISNDTPGSTKVSDVAIVDVDFRLDLDAAGFGTIEIQIAGLGTVKELGRGSPNSTTVIYPPGTQLILKATAAPNYEFVEWIDNITDGIKTATSIVVTMDRHQNFTARFGIIVPAFWYSIHEVVTDPLEPDGDPDADGFSNREEYELGTDPDDATLTPASTPVLDRGWNLIGLENQPQKSDSFNDILGITTPLFVKYWNPWTKQLRTDGPIVVKRGYWVFATTQIPTRNHNGYGVINGVPERNVRLFAGWNLISVTTTLDISNKLANASIARSIWSWDATGRRFVTSPGDTLIPGRGYWVYANGDISLN